MSNDFFTEYSQLSDGELLHLASDLESLTTEAATALEAELQRRHLTESDRVQYEKFVERTENREARRRRRRLFGTRKEHTDWFAVFCSVVVMVLLWLFYVALPSRFHMMADWEKSAPEVMIASVILAAFSRPWWRRISFWFSWMVSSAIHLILVHAWRQRVGDLSRNQGEMAFFAGFLLFGLVFGLVSLLRRNFYGAETTENS